jgi:hypothetical protein
VFVTAVHHEDPFIKQGYEVGAVDYFSKPYDPDILRVKVGIYASFRQKSDLLKEWERQIQASEELLRAGRKFSSMIERLRMGVIVTDAEGRRCYTNSEVIDPGVLEWWDAAGGCSRGARPRSRACSPRARRRTRRARWAATTSRGSCCARSRRFASPTARWPAPSSSCET